MSSIMIYGEIKAGKIKKTAFELASEGRKLADQLGGTLSAVLMGSQAEQFAPDLARYGVDTVYVAEAPELDTYNSEYYAQALAHLIGEKKPDIVLISHSMQGKDLAPRTAAKLGVAAIADCVSFQLEGPTLVGKRPMYAGKCYAQWTAVKSPQIASAGLTCWRRKGPEGRRSRKSVVYPGYQPFNLRDQGSKLGHQWQGGPDRGRNHRVRRSGNGWTGLYSSRGDGRDFGSRATVGASRAALTGWRPHSAR